MLNDVSSELYDYFYQLIGNKEKEIYFTVSSFFKHKKYNLELEKGKYYLFKISTLDVEVFSIFTSFLFKNKILNEDICIGNAMFKVKEIICDENKSKYAFRLDRDKLKYLNSKECNINEYNLKIITPIVFKVGSKFYNDISVDMLFKNLIKKFNTYSGYVIEKKYLENLSKVSLTIEKPIKQELNIDKFKSKGIKCCLNFKLNNLDESCIGIARTLIEFSLYSGIGYKCEVGFGQSIMDTDVKNSIKKAI